MTHYVGEKPGWKPARKLCDQAGERYWKKDRARNKLRKKLKKCGKRKVRERKR